jgi:hypothetical protein
VKVNKLNVELFLDWDNSFLKLADDRNETDSLLNIKKVKDIFFLYIFVINI